MTMHTIPAQGQARIVGAEAVLVAVSKQKTDLEAAQAAAATTSTTTTITMMVAVEPPSEPSEQGGGGDGGGGSDDGSGGGSTAIIIVVVVVVVALLAGGVAYTQCPTRGVGRQPRPDLQRQRAPGPDPPPGWQTHAQANPAFLHQAPDPAVDGPQYAEVGPAVVGRQYAEVGPAAPVAPARYDLPGSYPSSSAAPQVAGHGAGSNVGISNSIASAGRSPAFSASAGYEQPDDVLAAAAVQAASGGEYAGLEGPQARYAPGGGGRAGGAGYEPMSMPAAGLAEVSI